MATDRILLFCPDLFGHVQNYSFVFGRFFVENGRKIVLAAGRLPGTSNLLEATLIKEMKDRWDIETVDLGNTTGFARTTGSMVATLLDLENRYKPALTFIPAGDHIREALIGITNNDSTHSTNRLANFNSVSHIYRPARSMYKNNLAWLRHGITGYGKRRYLANRYFKKYMWDEIGISRACSPLGDFIHYMKDDRFFWFPDIFRAWGSESENNSEQYCLHMEDYRAFIKRNQGMEVILYFGGWCRRRGYDILLKLCELNKNYLFVSVGRPVPLKSNFRYDILQLKEILKREGRFFERELPFLPDNSFTDELFESINFLPLPYEEYLGLSGLIIQAAWYHKPVVVPNIGYMRSLVKKNGIGITYRPGNLAYLENACTKILRLNNSLKTPLSIFRECYTYDSIKKYLYSGFAWPENMQVDDI